MEKQKFSKLQLLENFNLYGYVSMEINSDNCRKVQNDCDYILKNAKSEIKVIHIFSFSNIIIVSQNNFNSN